MAQAPRMAGLRGKVFRPLLGWFVVSLILLLWRNHQQKEQQASLQFTLSLEGRAGRPLYRAELNDIPFSAGAHSGLGRKRLRIEAQDAESFVSNMFIGYGGKNLGHIRLARSRGDLNLHVVPLAERVVIEGAETNLVLTIVSNHSVSLPTGRYKVRAEFARLTSEHDLEIAARQVRALTIDPQLTKLSLRSNPTNAEFELLSVAFASVAVRSNTPVTVTDLPAGEYHLRIWREDYEKTVNLGRPNDRMEKYLELAVSAGLSHRLANPEEKRELLKILTSNRSVSGKKLELEPSLPFREIANRYKNEGCDPIAWLSELTDTRNYIISGIQNLNEILV